MRIVLNGKAHETGALTLAALLEEMGVGENRVATAVNGRFAPRPMRAATPLSDGDAVEVVSPMEGG
ncbi:MAG: sulfur carrier protein ThiS [Pseudomonadota bacterium]